jgi:hypothetical protein
MEQFSQNTTNFQLSCHCIYLIANVSQMYPILPYVTVRAATMLVGWLVVVQKEEEISFVAHQKLLGEPKRKSGGER